MKTTVKNIILLTVLVLGYSTESEGQVTVNNAQNLNLQKIDPYRIEVTYSKTSHLLFPAAIRYVDLGSDYLIASKAEDAENVLRVKASVRNFEEETNFSVITEDGHFYNFNVDYNPLAADLNYNLLGMQKGISRSPTNDVLFEELGKNSPSLVSELMGTIYTKDKRIIKNKGARSFGIEFLLKGLYINNGKFYFHTQVTNFSNVSFNIDFVAFKVVDKKLAKRTVIQERTLNPLKLYNPLGAIKGKIVEPNVFLLDQFTIANDKVLLIEIYEKNGDRHQVLKLKNSDLVKAKLITDNRFRD